MVKNFFELADGLGRNKRKMVLKVQIEKRPKVQIEKGYKDSNKNGI